MVSGLKRLLSPESQTIIADNQEDKHRRNNFGGSIDISLPISNTMEEPQLTTYRIDLDHTVKIDLATKNDLKEIDDRIVAQGQDIQQLRREINSLRNNVASIQSTVGHARGKWVTGS